MRQKALTLALLMIVSSLAGCIEGSDAKSDSTDDAIVDDRSGNGSISIGSTGDLDSFVEIIPAANSDDCNSGGGTWIEASERGGVSYCATGDGNESSETGEITQEDCERRGGTWYEERSTCYFEEDREDDREDDREITQEDCERRNGTWIATPDRPVDGHCDFGEDDREDDREERLIHQMSVVYPDNSSELMLCRGCIDLENMTGWNLTTTVLSERNISMNYSTHEVYGHSVSGINGSDSPSDWSWYWTLYVWNETDAANASWEVSAVGIDSLTIRNNSNDGCWQIGFCHIAWAPNTTNTSDIPVPRIFVENTDGDSEMTQEDCERRGGTWTEATDRDGVHYCDFEEEEREDDREESNDDSDPQADCEERGGTWVEETSECRQES